MNYDELYEKAEQLRGQDKPEEAIELYKEALAEGGEKDRSIHQMMGVCYKMAKKPQEALACYEKALEGASAEEVANINRDKGEALGRLGRLEEANETLQQSLNFFSDGSHEAERGATLGFIGRLDLYGNKEEDAVKKFAEADEILKGAENRHWELFNKLMYAGALALVGRKEESLKIVGEAEALTTEYGSDKHKERAQFIRDNVDNPEAIRQKLTESKAS